MAAFDDPMNALGHPIPDEGRQAGYEFVREVGLEAGEAWELVGKVARALEDDEPFRAQKVALASRLDLTGYYRLAATLLSTVEAPEAVQA